MSAKAPVGILPEEKSCLLDRPRNASACQPVLVAHSYFLRLDHKEWESGKSYPPLGTLYAASALRSRGHTVALYDAMLEPGPETFSSVLEETRPGLVVLFEDNFNYVTKMCLLQYRQTAIDMIRQAKAAGCQVVCSGPDTGDHADLYLDAGADYVITGEGERTLQELADHLQERSPEAPLQVQGLIFRDAQGHLVRTPPRPLLRELDQLPWPAWDLVDMERYRSVWLQRHGYFSLNVATTRGCPYRCNWCAKPIYGNRYTSRSPRQVVEEIACLLQLYRPDHLWITDDIFGLKPGWIHEFADLMVERNIKIRFKCLSRADLLSTYTVTDLRRAGCETVWVGAESGSQKILDAMEKGTRVEEIREVAATLKRAGIQVCFFLQFGYPGEELEDIQATRRLVRDCRPDDIGISVSYPLPGTRFFERVKSELGEKQNWKETADLALLFRGRYRPDFYRALHRLVHAEFRVCKALDSLRQRRLEWRRILNMPGHLTRWLIASLQVAYEQRRPV